MVHKLLNAIGDRGARYPLEGMIEMDESYFTVSSTEVEQSQGKQGRGAAGKQNVMVNAESTPIEDLQTGKTPKHVRYFKAKVLVNHQASETFNEKAIVFTDKSTSHADIAGYVEMHITEKSTKESPEETLRWVHIFNSNSKRNLQGNYHKIKGTYLQVYLDEFVYKLNRRYFGARLFDRLVVAAITGP
jgi:hypothetical protein